MFYLCANKIRFLSIFARAGSFLMTQIESGRLGIYIAKQRGSSETEFCNIIIKAFDQKVVVSAECGKMCIFVLQLTQENVKKMYTCSFVGNFAREKVYGKARMQDTRARHVEETCGNMREIV